MPFLGEKWGVDLTFAANHYKKLGWSVIPLLGSLDSNRAKHPAIKWGRYQHTHPLPADFQNWFEKQGFGGLGIVCGRVSKLVVLDFDDAALVSEFRHQYPDLTDTYTVQSGTRHLPHYYYHLPDDLDAHNRSVPGADFRADGGYVVAPPTQAGDAVWQVIQDIPLHILSKDDLKAIWRFLASTAPSGYQNRSERLSDANSGHSVAGLNPDPEMAQDANTHLSASATFPNVIESNRVVTPVDGARCRNSDTSINDLLALYRGRLDRGRNNALFQVACIARDRGIGKSVVIEKLATVHASQLAGDGSRESFHSRHAEALRTIESAYTRIPRTLESHVGNPLGVGIPTPSGSRSATTGLHNSIREWLLNHDHVAAARVLDGLLMSGLQAQSEFTERQAYMSLQQYRIGRRSIMVALKSVLPNGEPLFEKAANPLHTSPILANAATHQETDLKKCVLVRGANRVKTSGRPSTYYRLPDVESLAQRIGITLSAADTLTTDDLASPKTYRRALHRELVKRRPGNYSRGWLAERLGVSKWTSRRYEAGLNLVVQPMYIEQPLRWTNVEAVVPRTIEDASPGTFLETEDGKRYPPLRAIAIHLLDTGHKVVHKTRVTNHYSFSESIGVGIPTPAVPSQTKAAVSFHHVPEANDSRSHLAIPCFIQAWHKTSNEKENIAEAMYGVKIPTPVPTDTQHQFWLCPSCLKTHIAVDPPANCVRCGRSDWERVPEAIWRDPERLKTYWQSRWRDKHPAAPRIATPLINRSRCRNSDTARNLGLYQTSRIDAESERAAQQAHERVPDLSRINALRLVSRYGIHTVEDAIDRLAHRSGIRSPAGFLISLLKSEHLFYSREVLKPHQQPVEGAAVWVQRMTESAYVDFLENADEFIDRDKLK